MSFPRRWESRWDPGHGAVPCPRAPAGAAGHSFSYGRADAAIAVAPSAALAAAATAIGNQVQSEEDIAAALRFAQGIKGLVGAAVIKGDRIGA